MCHYCTLRVIIPSWLLFAVINGVLIFWCCYLHSSGILCFNNTVSYFLSSVLILLYACRSKFCWLFFSQYHTFPNCSFPVFLNSFSYPLLICRDRLFWATRAYYHASTPCSLFLPLNADSGDRTHVLCL